MIRHKWIIDFRNKLAELNMECDSYAAIEGSRLTKDEREYLSKGLIKLMEYIEERVWK